MALPTGDSPITKTQSSGSQNTTANVVNLFGLSFDRNDPLTYFLFLGILTVILLLMSSHFPNLALGLAFTALLAVAFSHK